MADCTSSSLIVKDFAGFQPYTLIFEQMKSFTLSRVADTPDQLWLLEHCPVFTQGQAGKAEHILMPGDIPIVQSDRGGQVTYHGPGQLMIYTLWNIKSLALSVKTLVCQLENFVIDLLAHYHIQGHRIENAPGIYVAQKKIASLGLRIKKGFCYHGISLNIDMDLSPFSRINPCGVKQLEMVQIKDFKKDISLHQVKEDAANRIQLWHKNRLLEIKQTITL